MYQEFYRADWPPDAAAVLPHFAGQLAMALATGDRSIYIQSDAAQNVELLVRGIATFLPQPVHGFVLHTDDPQCQYAPDIVAPLLVGDSVVLARSGGHELVGMLHNQWVECTETADGTTFAYGNFVMEAVTTPGFLAAVHIGDGGDFISYHQPICRMRPTEVAALHDIGRRSNAGGGSLDLAQV